MDTEQTMGQFRFADLFAGLGGFHIALRSLGGRAVFAAEWDENLKALYELNHGILPVGDINAVDPFSIPDHEVLTAGFPCQPFSKAGEQQGFKHSLQGQLFFAVEAILAAKRPQYFILENVPNLLRHDDGKTLQIILASLRALDYTVALHKYSPHHFGVPQVRDRVYVVGSRHGLDKFNWPAPAPTVTTIRDVLDERPREARPISGNIARALNAWDSFLRAMPADVKMPSFPIWAMEFGATYPFEGRTPWDRVARTASGIRNFRGAFGISLRAMDSGQQLAALPSHARRPQAEFPQWKVKFIRQNRQFYEENRSWIDPWLAEHKLATLPSSLQKLEWNAQGGDRNLWDYVIQTRASGVRVKRPSSSPSLVAMTDTQVPIIGWEQRYMTTAECARLQSLGRIALPDSRSGAYKALGNAVNSKVVAHVAAALLHRHIESPAPWDSTAVRPVEECLSDSLVQNV